MEMKGELGRIAEEKKDIIRDRVDIVFVLCVCVCV
jgi:hypothetical protein